MHLTDYAASLANNHDKFTSFGWSARPIDAHNWTVVYTHNRDSDALERANGKVITRTLAAFDDDTVRSERHGHWACGWVEGFAIRVYDKNGVITPAFKAYAELTMNDDYPVLDDEVYAEEERDEANEVWQNCYNCRQRLDYIRRYRSDFNFTNFTDLLECVRGTYFGGVPSEILS